MIRRYIAIAALTFGLSNTAFAARIVESHYRTYELTLQNVVLPQSAAGRIIFKTCGACDSMSMRVTAATSFYVEKKAMPLADWFKAAESLRQAAANGHGVAVYLMYDTRTKSAARIVLDPLDD